MGLILVVVAAFLWATVGVMSGLMTSAQVVDPVACGLARTALGSLVLVGIAIALRAPKISWRHLQRCPLAVFGIAGAVFQISLFAAFSRVGVTVTVAVTVCAPVVLVTAGEILWRKQLPQFTALAAICIACGGVFLAMPNVPAPDTVSIDVGGATLLISASVAFACVAISARMMSRDADPLRMTALGLGATALTLSAVKLTQHGDWQSLLDLPAKDLAIIGYTGIVATGLAYLAFVHGMRLSRSAASGLAATLIEPGVAALLASLVLDERLTHREFVGCLLMMVAMVMLYRCERRLAHPL
jgi:DME family drug/metabolite transporter